MVAGRCANTVGSWNRHKMEDYQQWVILEERIREMTREEKPEEDVCKMHQIGWMFMKSEKDCDHHYEKIDYVEQKKHCHVIAEQMHKQEKCFYCGKLRMIQKKGE